MNAQWQTIKLKDVADLIMGQSPKSDTYNKGGMGLPFYQGKADFGSVFPKARIYCSEPIKVAEKDDVLISVRAPVGDLNLSSGKSCIGRGLAAIRARKINYLFLYYQLKSLQKQIENLGVGSTFKSINKNILADLELSVPESGGEQQTIATILSKIQEAIENQDKIIKTTTELKKSLMRKIFSEGLNGEPLKETEIGKIPKSWEVATLEGVSKKLKAGGTPSTGNKNFWGGKIPLVKVEDVVNARKYLARTNLSITEDGLNNSSAYLLPADSILFTMYGTAGEVTINTVPVAPTQNVLGIIKSDAVDNEYLYYALNFSKTDTLERIMDKTIFKHFTLAKAKKLLLPLPPMNEQKEIAKILSAVDSKIEIAKKLTSTKTDLFKSMLNNLMSGEIRVNNLKL